jgi:predicted DNA-binding transcriptional regulator AlpA
MFINRRKQKMFLTTTDVLNRYGIKRTALNFWRSDKKFPAPITQKYGKLLWRLFDIESWEEANARANRALAQFQYSRNYELKYHSIPIWLYHD